MKRTIILLLVILLVIGIGYSQAPIKRNSINGHSYVDLGLPSGLKWATCNVGASSPSDYGNYYAWGETQPKSPYNEKNCKTYSKSESELKSAGIINSSGNLTMRYDAARANWGGSWRMPTDIELEELHNVCKWKVSSQDGHIGYQITGPNGKSIFLPFGGGYDSESSFHIGDFGHYWSSTCAEDVLNGVIIFFSSEDVSIDWGYRPIGRSVRPVSN